MAIIPGSDGVGVHVADGERGHEPTRCLCDQARETNTTGERKDGARTKGG